MLNKQKCFEVITTPGEIKIVNYINRYLKLSRKILCGNKVFCDNKK